MKTVKADATPDADDLRRAAVFRALSNPTRLGMLRFLAAHPDCLCGAVVDFSGLAQSTVSTHLAVLRDAGLVCGTYDGPATCLCLNREGLQSLVRSVTEMVAALEAACGTADECCITGTDGRLPDVQSVRATNVIPLMSDPLS